MNFQDLVKVERADWFIDIAFKTAGKVSDDKRSDVTKTKASKLSKSRTLELMKITTIQKVLIKHLKNIVEKFPSIDELPDFYQELINCTLDKDELKKSLGGVSWAITRIGLFSKKYSGKIKAGREIITINSQRKEYYGRICSVLKQIDKFLVVIEKSRRIMKSYPSIKTNIPTIAIFGFPNIGKTTLLSKLTGSTPDIQPYAFTTKGLNIGYIKKSYKKLQVIDTPGSLDRFDKLNNIEKQAYLALKHCAQKVIYVFDLTEPFPIEDQLELFKKLKKQLAKEQEIVVYFSKSDILDKQIITEFIKNSKLSNAYFNAELLLDKLKHIYL
ncbi:GTP-binding protein [Candidatus Woesearchaeota archaeon]|jgi:nucleolar GTP-binding protein|nr:GTP-binding protein [Candidatus Woesearchaeota archaeon]MBT6519311.1 GTP-binding protein [Candidatus Woesearchaeota archaeon]MBT7368964.1 GTP-binding protein [Candidatus Woesearchaeota archaeon]